MISFEITLPSQEETERLAHQIAPAFTETIHNEGLLIGLSGELGGGKTTFSSALCRALGVREPVSSPTFVLEHEYEAGEGVIVEHWDLYRLREGIPEELLLPIEAGTVRLVEWIERSSELIQQVQISMTFEILDQNSRMATLSWKQDATFGRYLEGILQQFGES